MQLNGMKAVTQLMHNDRQHCQQRYERTDDEAFNFQLSAYGVDRTLIYGIMEVGRMKKIIIIMSRTLSDRKFMRAFDIHSAALPL